MQFIAANFVQIISVHLHIYMGANAPESKAVIDFTPYFVYNYGVVRCPILPLEIGQALKIYPVTLA